MKSFLLLLLFHLCLVGMVRSQPANNAKDYINQYEDIVVEEMGRSGVPASVLLAIAMIESSFGSNELAVHANNHFAVSCNEKWEGETLFKWGKSGEITCYKSFSSALESFVEHTDLMINDPKLEDLFYLPRTDYQGWIKGLEKKGFFKIQNYSENLIQIIETFQLYNLDQCRIPPPVAPPQTDAVYHSNDEVIYINGLKAVRAKKDESALEFASRMGISLRKLLKFNDLDANDNLYPNQFLFLQKKKKKFEEAKETHPVQTDENMYLIAQQYGIQLDNLLKMNQLARGEEAAVGEPVYLKTTAPNRPKLRIGAMVQPSPENQPTPNPSRPAIEIVTPPTTVTTPAPPTNGLPNIPDPPKFKMDVFSINPDTVTQPQNLIAIYPYQPEYLNQDSVTPFYIEAMRPQEIEVLPSLFPQVETPPVANEVAPGKQTASTPPPMPNAYFHVVQKGDTLYKISKLYDVKLQDLMKLNQLTDTNIEIGQSIRYQ